MQENAQMTISVEEAGAVLGLSRASAYRGARRGEIPTIRVGRRLLVPKPQLDRLLFGDSAKAEATP